MFQKLEEINIRPEPFEFYTASDLWTDEHTSKQMLSLQRKSLLNTFNTILDPGGSIVLDVYSVNAFEKREEATLYEMNLLNGFWSSKKYYGFLNTFKYEKEKVILDKYTIVESDRIRTVYNWLQYFSPEDLKKEFTEAGFAVESLYSDVAGTPYDQASPEFAVIAKKR